jgi:hypothetical protein
LDFVGENMKKTLVLIFLLFLIPIASAGVIEIGVKTVLKGEISAFFYNTSNGVLKLNPEFYNSGSVAYKTRARLNIVNSTDVIFTGWGKEETLMPGERKSFEIYWYTPRTENIVAKLRIYYGKETIEREVKFKVVNTKTTEDVFLIKNFRTYDDSIKFQLRSTEPLKNVIVIPKNYMMGWVFEQKMIENLDANKNMEVVIPYEASVWFSHNVTIDVVTEDGKYYSTLSFNLQKEKGFEKYFHYVTDRLNLLLNL